MSHPEYEKWLTEGCTPGCRPLPGSLADTVRAMLQRDYGFVTWTTGSARDTVEIELIPYGDLADSRLQFRLHSPDPDIAPVWTVFEYKPAKMDHIRVKWAADSVYAAWAGGLDTILTKPELAEKFFSNISIGERAKRINPKRMEVQVAAADIDLAVDVVPKFRLMAHVDDSLDRIRSSAKLGLAPCVTTGANGFSCEVTGFAYYPGDPLPNFEEILNRAKIQPGRVYLTNYKSAVSRRTRSAAVPPPVR